MKPILIIGGAHLDIVAEFEQFDTSDLDKPGKNIRLSLGGTGYNIVANLVRNGSPVLFYTFLKAGSLSGQIIKTHLQGQKIPIHLVQFSEAVGESGYVAHWAESKLRSAVSVSNLDQATFNDSSGSPLAKAMTQCAFVAIDTNLTQEQLKQVIDLADRNKKRVCVAGVSESKVKRLLGLTPANKDFRFALVTLNELEASSLLGHPIEKIPENGSNLCTLLFSEQVVVTQAAKGYYVFTRNSTRHFDAPRPAGAANELGAGDALFAGACKTLLESGQIDFNVCHGGNIKQFVLQVLSVQEATPGASVMPEPPRETTGGLMGVVCLCVALIAAVSLVASPFSNDILNWVTFLIMAMMAGACGTSIAHLFTQRNEPGLPKSLPISDVVLGMTAGVIVVLFLVLGPGVFNQMAVSEAAKLTQSKSDSHALVGTGTLLPVFALLLAFGSGFGFDKIFRRIQSSDYSSQMKGF